MSDDSYNRWIADQAGALANAMRHFRGDWSAAAIWVVPTDHVRWGALVFGTERPANATDQVSLGNRLDGVPYSHLRSRLWHACRSAPVCAGAYSVRTVEPEWEGAS